MPTRIPRAIAAHAAYLDATDTLQLINVPPLNYARYGWTALQSAAYTQYRNDTDGDMLIWNVKKKRSSELTQRMKTRRINFIAFADPLIEKVAAMGVAADFTVFNIKKPTGTIHHSHTVLTDQCHTVFSTPGGGILKAKSRPDAQIGRGKLVAGSDGVQYAYAIVTASATNVNAPIRIPANSDDGTQKEFRTGSTATIILGDAAVGSFIVGLSRYFVSTNPALSGPWTPFNPFKL